MAKKKLGAEPDLSKIVKLEATEHDVVLWLANGVAIRLSSNSGYVHLNFACTEVPLRLEHRPDVRLPNIVNIQYTPMEGARR